jgi:predicted polyphosphate/ATP-dependent NAD kinase
VRLLAIPPVRSALLADSQQSDADKLHAQVGLRIGLVVNPVAGIGGAVGLRGSDGESVQQEARRRSGIPRGQERLHAFLVRLQEILGSSLHAVEWLSWGGEMGCRGLAAMKIPARQLGQPEQPSTSADTKTAIKTLCAKSIDLLIFVGGDGTARDVLNSVSNDVCVLGLPAGVKMHSGVFAISPAAAAEVVAGLLQGRLVGRIPREVRDYEGDLQASDGPVVTRRFGELWVPEAASYLQQMKIGGREDEGLVVEEIVSHFLDHEELYEHKALVLGPGSTCLAIKQALGLTGTLLGVDVRLPNGQCLENVTRDQLLTLVQGQPVLVVLSFTRHQGFLLGRGNQQLGAELFERLKWPGDVMVLGSRTKLASLEHRPLLVDTGSPELDRELCGLVSVLTGYEDFLLYRVGTTLGG